MSLLEKAKAIRAEAWKELMSSPQFAAFKASDDFVLALGGGTAMPSAFGTAPSKANGAASPTILEVLLQRKKEEQAAIKRITQADAAEAALREKGEPLPVGRFMEAAEAKGARFSGKDALANFRSAISKDTRFYSFSRNNMYFWWFTGEALPPGWNETADPDLLAGSAASSAHSSQKGGEAHAATTN